MTIRLAVQSLAFCAGLCACGPTQTMEKHMQSLDEKLTTSSSDLSGHKSAIAAAADVGAMNTLEGTHATRLAGDFDAMVTLVKDMKSCTRNGVAPDTAAMSAALAAMKSESDSHKSAMAAAANVTAARAEEDRHQQAITEKMTMMNEEQTSMMGMAAGYQCTMSM